MLGFLPRFRQPEYPLFKHLLGTKRIIALGPGASWNLWNSRPWIRHSHVLSLRVGWGKKSWFRSCRAYLGWLAMSFGISGLAQHEALRRVNRWTSRVNLDSRPSSLWRLTNLCEGCDAIGLLLAGAKRTGLLRKWRDVLEDLDRWYIRERSRCWFPPFSSSNCWPDDLYQCHVLVSGGSSWPCLVISANQTKSPWSWLR